MAAAAIIVILVVLMTIILFGLDNMDLAIAAISLGGCIVGITIAAGILSSVVYCQKRTRDTVIQEHAWKIFSLPTDSPVLKVSNTTSNANNLLSQAPNTSQQKSTSHVNNREAGYHSQVEVNERQHREIIRHLPRPQKDIFIGTNLAEAQENSTIIAVDVQIHTEQVKITPENPSQLESYC